MRSVVISIWQYCFFMWFCYGDIPKITIFCVHFKETLHSTDEVLKRGSELIARVRPRWGHCRWLERKIYKVVTAALSSAMFGVNRSVVTVRDGWLSWLLRTNLLVVKCLIERARTCVCGCARACVYVCVCVCVCVCARARAWWVRVREHTTV